MTNTSPARIRRRRRRRPISFGVIFVCAGLCLLLGLFEKPAQSPRASRIIRTVADSYSFAEYSVPVRKSAYSRRVIYPYSVIPGGVRNAGDLVREVNRDPVVAAHYADFKTADARTVRVQDAKLVYVSYRVDNKVFWTAQKVKLPQGEQLLTDGQNLVRARCGNRVSAQPQQPTSQEEPAPEILDTPIIPVDTFPMVADTVPAVGSLELIEDVRIPMPLLPSLVNPPEMLIPANKPSEERILPYIPPSYYPPLYIVTERHLDVSGVPEPGTLLLVASGLAAQVLIRISSKK